MRILDITDLKPTKGISFSRPHIYRLVRDGKFPKPIHLGKARIGFVEAEVDDWLAARGRSTPSGTS